MHILTLILFRPLPLSLPLTLPLLLLLSLPFTITPLYPEAARGCWSHSKTTQHVSVAVTTGVVNVATGQTLFMGARHNYSTS